jgi:hypothetical protein
MLLIAASFFTLNQKRMGTLSLGLMSIDRSLLEFFKSSNSSIKLIAIFSDTVDEVKAEKLIMLLRFSVN